MPSTRFRVAGASINQTTVDDPGIANAMRGIAMLGASKRESRRMDIVEGKAEDSLQADMAALDKLLPGEPGEPKGEMQEFSMLSPELRQRKLQEAALEAQYREEAVVLERGMGYLESIGTERSKAFLAEVAGAMDLGMSQSEAVELMRDRVTKIESEQGRFQRGMAYVGNSQAWMESRLTPIEGQELLPMNDLLPPAVAQYAFRLEYDMNGSGDPMTDKEHREFQNKIRNLKQDEEAMADSFEQGAQSAIDQVKELLLSEAQSRVTPSAGSGASGFDVAPPSNGKAPTQPQESPAAQPADTGKPVPIASLKKDDPARLQQLMAELTRDAQNGAPRDKGKKGIIDWFVKRAKELGVVATWAEIEKALTFEAPSGEFSYPRKDLQKKLGPMAGGRN